MELGALICLPWQPKCEACPLSVQCVARRENRVSNLPSMGHRAKQTRQHFVAFVTEKRGRFLVRQRPEGVVNGHLWEFPNAELIRNGSKSNEKRSIAKLAGALLGTRASRIERVCTLKHSITRFRIVLDVFRVSGRNLPRAVPSNHIWLKPGELRRRPFTAAHKRILALLV